MCIFLISCQAEAPIDDCFIEEPIIIEGASMAPMVPDGSNATLLRDFYECNEPERNDIILYESADEIIIKQVRAIPDDAWRVEDRQLFINGELATNSEGKAYAITPKMQELLQLYASYDPLPYGHYLILSDYTGNAQDSRRLGIVNREDFIGKVIVDG